MTSQGQRFRRRALRRGYKVDEVDIFLDRVEATLNGERVDATVRSQEVHDVVFRVRFGGYDEWQVDLHLDRVERQLADQEPGDNGFDRAPGRAGSERMGERLPERMPPSMSGGPAMAGAGPGLAGAGLGAAAAFERGDRPPMGGMSPRDLPPRDMPVRDDRIPPPPANNRPMQPVGPPAGWSDPNAAPQRPAQPSFPDRPQSGFPGDRSAPGAPLPERPPFGGNPYNSNDAYGNEPTFAGFEPGRRGRPDMTSEMRMPDAPPAGPSAGAPPMAPPGMGPGSMGPGAMGPSSMGPGGGGVPAGDVQRIDQLRRTFQLRRFGSGYDRAEVDRLFDGVIGAMSGRGSMPIDESELDPHQFSLVPGGYFESEVDQALREVRDIIRRR